ncbi:inorganic diphosphatase [Streptomyces sp. NPDC002476]|uniref:inorganic diphosphatase n=1 Tax=Streptomyces sp. NPDC002476 TaxID=3364648 RepID=UPI003681AE68
MSRITVEVESTIGSSDGSFGGSSGGSSAGPSVGSSSGSSAVPLAGFSPPDVSDASDGPEPSGGADGWPVGEGRVEDTLDTDGRSVRTLVLMREPARPGDEVAAWPVALLHLNDGRHDVDEVLCVAEAEPFIDLVDATDLRRWHAEPDVWATALGRLSPGTVYRVTGCGSRREADQLVSDARHAYLRLTGCLE